MFAVVCIMLAPETIRFKNKLKNTMKTKTYTVTQEQLKALSDAFSSLGSASMHPALPRNVATLLESKADAAQAAFGEIMEAKENQ